MADHITKSERSRVMAAVRSDQNRTTELRFVSLLRNNGIVGWRRRQSLIGKPDFVFRKERVVVFVDGCFWHGCPRHCRKPNSRQDYWFPKLERNKVRDRIVTKTLRDAGWKVMRVWECDLSQKNRPRVLGRLLKALGYETTASL